MCVNVIKKYGKIIISLILAFSFILISVKKVYSVNEENIEISAPAAILMEPKTGKVIYEKNSH